eukprot:40441_1
MPLQVFLVGTRFFIWSLEDAETIRFQYRLIGECQTPANPQKSSNNDSSASSINLPLMLTPEEVVCAMEHEWIQIVEHYFSTDQDIISRRSLASIEHRKSKFREDIASYKRWCEEKEKKRSETIYIQQNSPCRGLFAAKQSWVRSDVLSEQNIDDEKSDNTKISPSDLPQSLSDSLSKVQISPEIPAPSTAAKTQKSESVSKSKFPPYSSLAIAEDVEFRQFRSHLFLSTQCRSPQTDRDTRPVQESRWRQVVTNSHPHSVARCAVFNSLHTRGYYLTSGLKFGGDFLVYDGPPHKQHSKYIARIFYDSGDLSLGSPEVIALCRVANSVRKAVLICNVKSDTDVDFCVVSWVDNVKLGPQVNVEKL